MYQVIIKQKEEHYSYTKDFNGVLTSADEISPLVKYLEDRFPYEEIVIRPVVTEELPDTEEVTE